MGKTFNFVPTPTKCDICGAALTTEMYDSVLAGYWGCNCPDCHKRLDGSIGTGRGQRYEREADGLFWYREG